MQDKNNCVGSYSVSGYTRADGTEVSGYTRTCGAAHLSHEDEQVKLQERANLLFNNTQEKDNNGLTKGAARINNHGNETIAGVKRGEAMSYEQANGGRVNPEYSPWIKNHYTQNCQSCVAVFEARMRGYDVETTIPKGVDNISEVEKLKDNPNIAFIDPNTGRVPDFKRLDVRNKEECENVLKSQIKQGERYILGFTQKKSLTHNHIVSHIVEVWKNNNNELRFYDPQVGKHYDSSMLNLVKTEFGRFEERLTPKLLRVDDKELNYKMLNIISKPARKS